MRRLFILISLLCGSTYLVSANASEQHYAFEVEDEGWYVEEGDPPVTYQDQDDQPIMYERTAYNQSSYSGNKKYKKQKSAKRSGGGFPSSRHATGRSVFIFNPNSLTWAVYDGSGNLVRTGHGSGGRKYCPDIRRGCKTPSGTYSIIGKAGPGFRSSRYPLPGGGAPMPYAMFFSKFYAIHGSNDVPGYNASHGCIRVYTSDARWLSQNIIRHGTTVIIHGY